MGLPLTGGLRRRARVPPMVNGGTLRQNVPQGRTHPTLPPIPPADGLPRWRQGASCVGVG